MTIILETTPLQLTTPTAQSVPETVHRLMDQYRALWWRADTLPDPFGRRYTVREQAEKEKQLETLSNELTTQLKRAPKTAAAQETLSKNLRSSVLHFARHTLELEEGPMHTIEQSGLVEAVGEFARMARRYDPHISDDDIFQAARNVMTMNFMQILLGMPVEVTPAVFAYSMLYPYSDNYFDDPRIPPAVRLDFSQRFRQRLMGDQVSPRNAYEQKIYDMVTMVESQFDRPTFPQVYDSILAIHTAQERSMALQRGDVSPYELDVLGIIFEKGGTSVLADGYLVAGSLTETQASFMFGYGAYTQVLDDLEDTQQDIANKIATVFTQTRRGWTLDAVTDRALRFGVAVFEQMDAFDTPAARELKQLIMQIIVPVTIVAAGNAARYYTRPYLGKLEAHIPFRYASLHKTQQKLGRLAISPVTLLDWYNKGQKEPQRSGA